MTDSELLALKDYMDAGKHMPKELRDFHDLKDLFKAIGTRNVGSHSVPEEINFRQGMIYVVDHFLWFMAKHGYELKKVKSKIPRHDLQETIKENQKASLESLRAIINSESK